LSGKKREKISKREKNCYLKMKELESNSYKNKKKL
jgi:hypothetical protein